MQCADFVFKYLNKTAPDIFYNLFDKVDYKKTASFNRSNLNIPKVKTDSAKRGLFFGGVKIYNALLMHLKKEKLYLPFEQGLKEIFIG